MGYQTDFKGRLKFTTPLTAAQVAYIRKFSDTRRMRRDAIKAEMLDDYVRPKNTSAKTKKLLRRLKRHGVLIFRHDDGPDLYASEELKKICDNIGLFDEVGENKFTVQES